MVVEYVAAADDGAGRVFARQVCAEQLPKDLQALVPWCMGELTKR